MEDEVFHVGAAAYYLGQLCPLMSQVVGYANLANVGSNSICMVCTLLQCLYLGTDIPVPQQTSIDHSDYDEIKVKGNTLRC